jgi:parallel beta-helix repeat protein
VAGSNNTISYHNVISGNSRGGVLLSAGSGNTISQNEIVFNGKTQTGPGIVLNLGANNNVAASVLKSAKFDSTTKILTVTGTFTAPKANVTYELEFFANITGDPEGFRPIGTLGVIPVNAGMISFTFSTAYSSYYAAHYPLITATLTDGSGDTSRFSNGVTVTMT